MRQFAIIATLAIFGLAGTIGCGGGGGGNAIPTASYAALTYEITANGTIDVFADDDVGDEAVVTVAVLDPAHVPTVDGSWFGRLRVQYTPLLKAGTYTPENPFLVDVTITRTGTLVTVVVSYLGTEVFRITDAVLPVGGSAEGTVVQDTDTYQYVLVPWDATQSTDLVQNWDVTGFTGVTTMNVTAIDTAQIEATILEHHYIGRRLGDSAYLIDYTGPTDATIILEVTSTGARGYQTSGTQSTSTGFDTFTMSTP